jgi:hypothetical protein
VDIKWIQVAQVLVQRWDLVNTVRKGGGFLDQMSDCQFCVRIALFYECFMPHVGTEYALGTVVL